MRKEHGVSVSSQLEIWHVSINSRQPVTVQPAHQLEPWIRNVTNQNRISKTNNAPKRRSKMVSWEFSLMPWPLLILIKFFNHSFQIAKIVSKLLFHMRQHKMSEEKIKLWKVIDIRMLLSKKMIHFLFLNIWMKKNMNESFERKKNLLTLIFRQ